MRNTLPYTTKKGHLTKNITFTLSQKEMDTLFESNTAGVEVVLQLQPKLLSRWIWTQASAIFDKQVHEKKLKGYTEGAGQAPYVGSTKEEQISGYLPQLLNPIDDALVELYLEDPQYCLQQKMDGKRIILTKTGSKIEAINRKGLFVGLSSLVESEALDVGDDFVIDGEMIGDVYYVFDICGPRRRGY